VSLILTIDARRSRHRDTEVMDSTALESRQRLSWRSPRPFTSRSLPAALRIALELVFVVAASVIFGAVSLEVAGAVPAVLQPLVDCPSGWTLVTGLVIWSTRRSALPLAALYGVVSFIALNFGWYVVGGGAGSVDAVFWVVIACLAGPVVGGAVGWLRSTDRRAAAGGGVLCGIFFGDSVVSTLLIGNIGLGGGIAIVLVGALLLTRSLRRATTRQERLLTLLITAATAACYGAAWGVIAI